MKSRRILIFFIMIHGILVGYLFIFGLKSSAATYPATRIQPHLRMIEKDRVFCVYIEGQNGISCFQKDLE